MSSTKKIDANNKQSVLDAILRQSLLDFVRKSCHAVGNKTYREPPHVGCLCTHLERIHAGRTMRLIINMPPRSFKSFITTVCFSAWQLGHDPSKKIMVISHDQKLASFLADQIRTILQTDWYKRAFPTRLRDDYDRQMHFQTTRGGGVFATSMEGGLTGQGADIIIIDDPLDAGHASSPITRNRANELFDTKIASRLNSQAKGIIIVVAQRLHVGDLPGHLLGRGDYEHLCLPLIATEPQVFDEGDFHWERPKGDVLDPAEWTPEAIDRRRRVPKVFEAECQQNPISGPGNFLRREWFPVVNAIPPTCDRTILSFDLGQSAGENSSYSCGLVFKTNGTDHYLYEVMRRRGEYPDIKSWVLGLLANHRSATVLMEDAAFGSALIPELQRLDHAVRGIKRPTIGKQERVFPHLDTLSAGRVRLVPPEVWHAAFLAEMETFPDGSFSDQVDALSQFLDFIGDQPLPPPKLIAQGSPRKYGLRAGSHPMRNPNILLRRMRGR